MDHTPPSGRSAPMRWLMLVIAIVFLLLGIIGLFLPVMPTVPFLIVAAWAAARSSPRLHQWLYQHPRFGQQLRDWDEAGLVPRRAKWVASIMMTGSATGMVAVLGSRWPLVVAAVVTAMAFVGLWLWRQPEQRPGS